VCSAYHRRRYSDRQRGEKDERAHCRSQVPGYLNKERFAVVPMNRQVPVKRHRMGDFQHSTIMQPRRRSEGIMLLSTRCCIDRGCPPFRRTGQGGLSRFSMATQSPAQSEQSFSDSYR